MSALRIAQVCADPGIAPGATKGAALHLRGMAAGLMAEGHRVATYAARPAEGDHPAPVALLADLERSPREPYELIYERYALGHLGGLHAARRRGVPFVLEVNAPLLEEATRHRPGTIRAGDADVEAELLARADLVVTVSNDLAAWIQARRRGPIAVIPNGFEPDWFPAPARVTEDGGPLVFLGHPKPWHGALRLIRLLLAVGDLGHRPDLLVIGGGPGAADLRTAARAAGVQTRVHTTGALAPRRAAALLQEAAIGLAPYPRVAPFYFSPLKVVDYLAAGLPVVTTAQGDLPGLVEDAGILVDPDDDAALARAVAELLGDPVRRGAMGAAGRARAHRSMTWRQGARLLVAALDDLPLAAAGAP